MAGYEAPLTGGVWAPADTHVGVNRQSEHLPPAMRSLPHARGGEPPGRQSVANPPMVFPTHVGVNRLYLDEREL